jgi:hypothetical protein
VKTLIALVLIAGCIAVSACSDDASAPEITPAGTQTRPPSEPAITINQPGPRQTVNVPFAISGAANVFEGVLVVRVLDNAGTALCERTVLASAGTGTSGNWTTTMAFPPPVAPLEATIRAFSRSPQDGSERDITVQQIVVSPDPPAIVIGTPRCNAPASKSVPLVVSGQALVFEAALNLELRNADGAAVLSERAMSANGTERSPWSTTLDLSGANIPPGAYDLVAFDFSARDGAIENEFSIPIEVTE